MNKTIFIMSGKKNIIDNIESAVKNSGLELFVVGKGDCSDSTIKNMNFSQPNFILTEELEFEMAKNILDVCTNSRIIMIAEDINRAASVQTEIEKTGISRINYINSREVNPNDLMQILNDLEVELDYSFETNDSPMIIEEKAEEKDSSDTSEPTVMTTEDFLNSNQSKEVAEVQEVIMPSNENPDYSSSNFITKDNVMNLKNKTITIFSKKGGSGKSTIAKEMANLFSNVTLPKRFSNQKENLKVCLLDLDLERGNIRTLLGIHNPIPNIYMWINDILTKNLEQGMPLEKIKFNKIAVLENYITKPQDNRKFYSVITDQGELNASLLSRIARVNYVDALQRIIDIIIDSLKKVFDIVIIDAGTDITEISLSAFLHSDDILYVVEPNLTDVENLKVTLDEMSKLEGISSDNISLIINKQKRKMPLTDKIKDVMFQACRIENYNIQTGQKEKNELHLLTTIDFDEIIDTYNNQFMFITNTNCRFKTELLLACKELLPIFKTKNGAQIAGSKNNAKKELLLKKKKQLEDKKKAAKAKQKLEAQKNTVQETTNSSPTEVPTTEVVDDKTESLAFLKSDLSKITYDDFIQKLSSFSIVKKINDFPYIKSKPLKINKKVWKQYSKNLAIQIKNAKKNKVSK